MTAAGIEGLGVEDLLSAVPMLADVADVEAARVSNIDSSSMTSEVWLKLANAVEEALRREDVSGVVITHGTDTMEETAFFLNLVVKSEKPVVLTGAMRPATALSAEGPLNLLNAVRIASIKAGPGRAHRAQRRDRLRASTRRPIPPMSPPSGGRILACSA